MPTATEVVKTLPSLFNGAKAKGYNRTIQLVINGDGGGKWWLDIKNQTCTLNEGEKADARLKLEIEAGDFVGYFTGQINPMDLVTSQKLRFSGPMTEGIAFNKIWNIPKKEG